MNSKSSVYDLTLVGVCAAVMAICAQIAIPLPFTPTPVTLQVFGVVLIGVILGPKLGSLALVVYTLLGAMGVPVFANWHGGLGVIVGPTGGYIVGFVIMAGVVGVGAASHNKFILYLAAYVGLVIDYVFGAMQLALVAKMSVSAALVAGVYPFVLKDAVIVVIAVLVGLQVRRALPKRNESRATA